MGLNQTIEMCIEQLCQCAEDNKDKNNIDTAIAEVEIAGVEYQITVSLIADKKIWVKEHQYARYSEVVKVHE